MSRTIHWFFSLGTGKTPATYVLRKDVLDRLRSWFVGAPPCPGPSGPFPSEALARKESVTAGLLELLVAPRDGVRVKFHLLATPQVGAGTEPFDRLLNEVPEWARESMTAAPGTEHLAERDPVTIRSVVDRVLRSVPDGDYVLFETSNGLRPLLIGTILAHSVLRATRPKVEVVAAVYGEFHAWPADADAVPESKRVVPARPSRGEDGRERAALSPIYDLTEFLDLPLWANAADNLQRRFDGRPLADLLRDSEPTLAGALDQVATALDLGWPNDLVEPLGKAGSLLGSMPEPSSGRAAVLSLARAGLDQLVKGAGSPREALDEAALAFRFDVAEFLAGSGRYGDALRVLREGMVEGAILALNGGRPEPDWREPAVRAAAERALFHGSDSGLWIRVGELRNAASHAKSMIGHAKIHDLAAPLKEGLIAEVREKFFDGDRLRADVVKLEEQPTHWYVERAAPARAGAVDAAIRSFDGTFPLRIPVLKGDRPPAKPTTVKRLTTLRGGNWASGRAKRARGAANAVIFLPGSPTDAALLAAALRDEGIRAWALVGDELWPLFPAVKEPPVRTPVVTGRSDPEGAAPLPAQ